MGDERSKGNGMFIPVVGLTPIFNLSDDEHSRVLKTMNNLSNVLGDKMGVKFEVVNCDLIQNQDRCCNPTGSHEVALDKDNLDDKGKPKLVCIHCLKRFEIAKEFKGGFFTNKKG